MCNVQCSCSQDIECGPDKLFDNVVKQYHANDVLVTISRLRIRWENFTGRLF